MRIRRFPISLITGLALVAGTTTPASAIGENGGTPSSADADRTASVVAQAQRDGGVRVADPLRPVAQNGMLTTRSANQPAVGGVIDVGVPQRSDGAIVSKARTSDGSVQQISIGLPQESPKGVLAAPAANGTVVFADPAGKVDVAEQADSDGSVRIHTILRNNAAPTTYTYPLTLPPGATATLDGAGGVRIELRGTQVNQETGGIEPFVVGVGGFAPAWAVDAAGKSVPTRYELADGSLRQVIDTSAVTAWPVTADPVHWWGYSINLSNTNTNRLAAALAGGAAIATIVAILAAGSIAGIPGGVVYGIAAALLALGSAVIYFCGAAGKGIVIKKAWVGPPWCQSR